MSAKLVRKALELAEPTQPAAKKRKTKHAAKAKKPSKPHHGRAVAALPEEADNYHDNIRYLQRSMKKGESAVEKVQRLCCADAERY